MALGKGSKSKDVQELQEQEVCFSARQDGNGLVFVHIRKKRQNCFAVWVAGGHHPNVGEKRFTAEQLGKVLMYKVMEITSRIKIKNPDPKAIRKILTA